MVQVSTDFVFGGNATRPYAPESPTGALGAYGASKLEGERLVREHLGDATIVRTAWVYSAHGANFVRAVVGDVGMTGFNRVWESPDALPSREELHAPQKWVARVGAQA